MDKKVKIYFCEICRQKIEVVEEGFGVLVCCGQEMKLVGEKDMMDTWTSAHHKPTFVCNECGQKIRVMEETSNILECCGQRMQPEEASVD